MKTAKTPKPEFLSAFGSTKDFYIYLINSEKNILSVADMLGRSIRQDFSYLSDIIVNPKREDISFPVFFAQSQRQNDRSCFSLLPNRTQVDPNASAECANPLLGLFLFDEEQYIFNKTGRRFFDCDACDYDFLLLISCEKGSPIEPYIQQIQAQFNLHNISSIIEKEQHNNKQISDLQGLFINTELLISEYQQSHLNTFLGDGFLETITRNHPSDRVSQNFEPRSPLLQREDI